MYDVNFGEILIDGVNIKQYNIHSLRMKMGYFDSLQLNLTNESIYENLLFSKPDATQTEI